MIGRNYYHGDAKELVIIQTSEIDNQLKHMWKFALSIIIIIIIIIIIMIIINKKENLQNCGLGSPVWPKSKIERKWKKEYLDLAREDKTEEDESDHDTNCNWCAWYSHQRNGTGSWGITGRGETIQTTDLLRSASILWRVLETWGHLFSLKHDWKTTN